MSTLLLFIIVGCATVPKQHVGAVDQCFLDPSSLKELEDEDLQLLNREHFHVLYSNQHAQPYAVIYTLKYSNITHALERGRDFSDHFMEDDEVRISSRDADYRGSGFDRGHIAPSKDFTFSTTAARSTFVYSNISPQTPYFNRNGSWKQLEEFVRNVSLNHNLKIQVIAGPLLNEMLPRIGQRDTSPSVPKEFYKLIIFERDGACQGVGYKLSNGEVTGSYTDGETSISDLVDREELIFRHLLSHITASNIRPISTASAGSSPQMTAPVDHGTVKKSRRGICHEPNGTYYLRTHNYTPFKSIEDCLQSGGRLPYR